VREIGIQFNLLEDTNKDHKFIDLRNVISQTIRCLIECFHLGIIDLNILFTKV